MEQLKALLRQISVKKLRPDVSRYWNPCAQDGVSRRYNKRMEKSPCGTSTTSLAIAKQGEIVTFGTYPHSADGTAAAQLHNALGSISVGVVKLPSVM
jgi:hypothetical protein